VQDATTGAKLQYSLLENAIVVRADPVPATVVVNETYTQSFFVTSGGSTVYSQTLAQQTNF
jgi:hypothetical protein